jgi:phage recombination protein Bet
MNNAVAVQEPPSVVQFMAARYGMDRRAFEATLKATVVPAGVSNEQLAAFLLVAKDYNLNPITKEIYAFPAKGGGVQPIVGIDGWCNIINSRAEMDGMEFQDIMTDGKLTAVTCRIFRKDRAKPVETTEYMDECKRSTEPWQKWPARMLRHKALIQCARYAFGFSGIVDPDEADRMIDVTPEVTSQRPTSGTVTAKQGYGSATAMKKKHKEISEAISGCQKAEDIDAVKERYKADYELMGQIEPQIVHDLEGLAERRKAVIGKVTDANFESVSPHPVGDGGLTPEELEQYEQERAVMASRLSEEPPAFLRQGN